MNIQIRYCRICLDKNFIGQSIFEYYNNKSLPEIVMSISGIEINKIDNFSKLICFNCAKQLIKAIEIREKCLQTNNILHNWQTGASCLPPDKKLENTFPYKHCEKHCTEDDTEKTNDELWHKIVEETSAMSEELSTTSFFTDTATLTKGFDDFLANLISDSDDNDIYQTTLPLKNELLNNTGAKNSPFTQNIDAASTTTFNDDGREGELNPNQVSYKFTNKTINNTNDKCIECKHCLKIIIRNRTAYERYYILLYHLQKFQQQQQHQFKHKYKTPPCPICCHKYFLYKSNFYRHLLVHSNEKHFIYSKYSNIELCPGKNQHTNLHKMINDFQNPKIIYRTNYDNINDRKDDINYTSIANIMNSDDKDNTKVHHQQHNEYILECKVCNNHKTVSLTLYLQHMREKHQIDDTKPFQCRICNLTFASKQGMFRHIDNIHENNQKNLKNREKKFLCHTCGKYFYTNFHLEIHTRIHTGIKPYNCTICNKRFSQMSGLRIHQFTHTGEKPFACDICGKTFTQYGHVKEHHLIHSNEKKHICTICGHSFRVKGNLTAHMLVHSTKKPFSCGHCGKEYIQRTKLRAHVIKYHQPEYSDEDNDNDDDDTGNDEDLQIKHETDEIIKQQTIKI